MIPVRLEQGLQRMLAGQYDSGSLQAAPDGATPAFRYELKRPAGAALSLMVCVRSNAGIPLASAVVDLRPGDDAVVVPTLPLLAMEGYAHLKPEDRRAVESRVWSRRAFVTLEQA